MRFPSDSVRNKHDHLPGGPAWARSDSGRTEEGSSRGGRGGSGGGSRTGHQGLPARDARRVDPRDARPSPRIPPFVDPLYAEIERIEGATDDIDAFELFSAYYLGLARDESFRSQNLSELGRRFGIAPGLLKKALGDFGMTPEALRDSDFDLDLARLDIRLSPPGVSKRELARSAFEEFVAYRDAGPRRSAPSPADASDEAQVGPDDLDPDGAESAGSGHAQALEA